MCRSKILLWLFASLMVTTDAYNKPYCPSWPSDDVWSSELGNLLSADAVLHGPINPEEAYPADCENLGTDAYAISKAGNGICMHAHACAYEFCRPMEGYDYDIPIYSLVAQSEEDISAALKFAAQYDIEVSIKTTGHSYQGSSTARDSLLIWMQNYPKDGEITQDFADSCGDTYDVVGINGGETWNDVLEAVKGDYHIVSGAARSVSAAGGWLMGGGLSFSSRQYGIGVDQVVAFQLILANGTSVLADGCSNPDLFWALRGGGGGTFGVVTHVHYKLHPVTPIIHMEWSIINVEYLVNTGQLAALFSWINLWLAYWVGTSPTIDTRWSGFFNAGGASLVFSGTEDEAKESFVNEFDDWYYNVLVPNTNMIPDVWGALPPNMTLTAYPNWYEFKGGSAAYNRPEATDPTGDAYEFVEFIGARLMPIDVAMDMPGAVTTILSSFATTGTLGTVNYFLGGNINDVPDDATAVHPGMRNAVWSVFPNTPDTQAALRQFIPNNVTGICFNHHSGTEPDWRNACWGSNYAKLESIKDMYDPDHRFNCWHGVGYQGDENPPDERSASFSPLDCPTSAAPSPPPPDEPTGSPTSMPASTASLVLQPASSISMVVGILVLSMITTVFAQ